MKNPNLFLTLTALFVAPHFAGPMTAAREARPKVLFTIADDASRHFGAAYGCTWVKTSNAKFAFR